MEWIIVSNPQNGSVSCDASKCVYTPYWDYVGNDIFTYKVNNGLQDSNVASVTIEVLDNALPVANDQSVTTLIDTNINITLTASDANGDPLTYSIVTNPTHGTLSGTGAIRTYTPDDKYVGIDSFTFKANDGQGDSNVATVSITVGTGSGGANPVRNGTFEAGRDGNWTESSTGGWELITQSFPGGVTPHGGLWAVWLGGADNETSSLTQTGISMAGVRYLHYWYWIASEDVCGYDYAKVFVNGTEKQSFNLCDTANTSGWVQGTLDLNSYAGTTISLEFRATTDSSGNSNFFIDDVSITSAALNEPDDVRELTGDEMLPK